MQSMNGLRQSFPGRLISRFGDIHWPARSPDLAATDFFLWGHLKRKVFVTRPQTLSRPKGSGRLREAVQNIPMDMLHLVMQAFVLRLEE